MVDVRTRPNPSPPPYRRTKGPLIALVVLGLISLAAIAVIVANALDEPARVELGTELAVPTAPAPSAPVDPEAATKAEIIGAYRQSFEAFVAVASDPEGQLDDPRLSERMRGTALTAAQLGIRKLRADGHVLKVTQLEMNPRVVELGSDTAVVEDCGIDVSGVVDQRTGEVIEPAGPAEPELATATYELLNGVWMQTSFKDEKRPCVPES